MAERVVGLDIGTSGVKAAQVLRGKDKTYTVEKQASAALPRGAVRDGRVAPEQRALVVETIRALFEQAEFSAKEVILGLNSSSAVFMQDLLVPIMPPDDVPKALPGILAVTTGSQSIEDYELSYTVVGEEETADGRMLRLLVYSVRGTYANDIAELVTEAGLDVVGADLNALSALRSIATQQRPPRQLDALVDIGGSITMLMLHHNGVPKMLHFDPDTAGEVLTQRIADTLHIDIDDPTAEYAKVDDQQQVGPVAMVRHEYAQSLANKIAVGFSSFLDRSDEFDSIANVTLVGGGALLNELAPALRRAFGTIPLHRAAVAPNITAPNGGAPVANENSTGGDYLVAIGLGTGTRV